MKILFLFILIFHISHVNADEIYNLIKIPNLEVYKLKNDNKIRYLSAKNNFKIDYPTKTEKLQFHHLAESSKVSQY